jgi:hypothetical protein
MELPEWSNGIGKHIVKIEDGKNVVGNIRGNIVRFYQHWINGRSAICKGREDCSFCQSDDEKVRKATGKFRVNLVMREDPTNAKSPLIARVFEGGKRVYDQLLQLNKDMPIEKAWIRISRTGKGQQTQYILQFVAGENGLVKPTQEKEILTVPLHDLRLDEPEEDDQTDSNEEAAEKLPF